MKIFTIGKTIIKNIFSKPATLMYPKIKRKFAYKSRGKINIDIDKCIYCSICQKKCPSNAINVKRNEKIWEINRLKCIICNYCVEVCPKNCLSMDNKYPEPQVEEKIESFHA